MNPLVPQKCHVNLKKPVAEGIFDQANLAEAVDAHGRGTGTR